MSKVRAALTNRKRLLLDRNATDGRLAWSRRLRDLISDHCADLANDLSTAELVLVKRASMLTVQMEMLECQFAEQDGMATSAQLNDYQRCLNTARRTYEALGLRRRQKTVGPTLGQLLREQHRRDIEEAEVVNG